MSDTQDDLFGDRIDASIDEVIANLSGIEPEDVHKVYSPRLVEFYEMHAHTLGKMTELSEEQIHKIAAVMVAAIGDYFGGVAFYLPHNEKMRRFMRDIAISKEFDGTNINKLAKKFNCSHQTVYTAINNVRKFKQRALDL